MPAGQAITAVMLRASVVSRGPAAVRADVAGTHVSFSGGAWGGSGEVTLTSEGAGTRLVVAGDHPPFPLSIGWASRMLRRLSP